MIAWRIALFAAISEFNGFFSFFFVRLVAHIIILAYYYILTWHVISAKIPTRLSPIIRQAICSLLYKLDCCILFSRSVQLELWIRIATRIKATAVHISIIHILWYDYHMAILFMFNIMVWNQVVTDIARVSCARKLSILHNLSIESMKWWFRRRK